MVNEEGLEEALASCSSFVDIVFIIELWVRMYYTSLGPSQQFTSFQATLIRRQGELARSSLGLLPLRRLALSTRNTFRPCHLSSYTFTMRYSPPNLPFSQSS